MVNFGNSGEGRADDVGIADGGAAWLVDSTGEFVITLGEFMIVNEPGGVVGFSTFGFVNASRCIRNALSNCSLTDADDIAGAGVSSEVAFVSAAAASELSAGTAESLTSSNVDSATADVTPSSIPLALAN